MKRIPEVFKPNGFVLFYFLLFFIIVSCASAPKKDDSETAKNVQQQEFHENPIIDEMEISHSPLPEEETIPDTEIVCEIEVEEIEAAPPVEIIVLLPPHPEPELPVMITEPEPPVIVSEPEPPVIIAEPEQPPVIKPAPLQAVEAPQQLLPVPEPSLPKAAPPEPKPSLIRRQIVDVPNTAPQAVIIEPVREPLPVETNIHDELPVVPEVPQYDFSRTVRVTVGQLVEIPFRGTGWVFLGEAGARRGIVYDSRRLDPEGQSFIFRTLTAGIYVLKFYRQDFIRNFILNDYVQVTIGNAPDDTGSAWFNPPIDRGRIIAEPRWPLYLDDAPPVRTGEPARIAGSVGNTPAEKSQIPHSAASGTIVPPEVSAGNKEVNVTTAKPAPAEPPAKAGEPAPAKPAQQKPQNPVPARPEPAKPASGGNQSSKPPAAVSQTPDRTTLPDSKPAAEQPSFFSPDVYLKKVKEEFEAGRTASAVSLLDQFRKLYPSGSDEAWWLYGQCYEANGPGRNILAALDYYRRLVRDYPQSSRATDARKRIAYLERYYINIQ